MDTLPDCGGRRAHQGSIVEKLLQDDEIASTTPGRYALVIGVVGREVVGLARHTISIPKLRPTDLERMYRKLLKKIRQFADAVVFAVDTPPLALR